MSATLQRLLRTADECVPATNEESLIVELEEACLKWKEADDHLMQELEPRRTSWKELLPHRWGSEPELETHREYVDSLFTAFRRCLEGSNYSFPITASLKKYKQSRKEIQVDLDTIPELEAPPPLQDRQQHSVANASDQEGKIIHTFQIINPRTNQIHQRIELSSDQTLLHLRQTLYCVQDEINRRTVPETSVDNNAPPPPFLSETFCIRGDMYSFGMQQGNVTTLPTEQISQPVASASSTSSRPAKRTRLQDSAHRAKLLLQQQQPSQSTETTTLPSLQQATPVASGGVSLVRSAMLPSWEHVTLEQLGLALGEVIIFSHFNGCCEHRIQLLDIRRVAAVTTALPRELMRMKFRRRRCQICDLANAQQLVVNDRLSDCNPTFMCQMCYELLHYDREGNLLYSDFSVFPYIHDT